jgi:hypothetical protein
MIRYGAPLKLPLERLLDELKILTTFQSDDAEAL